MLVGVSFHVFYARKSFQQIFEVLIWSFFTTV